MSEQVTDFEAASERVKTLKQKPTNDQLLQLYGLYKQATVGDVNIGQPWAVQMEARAKWDAWNTRKGMSQEDAKQAYIKLVNDLLAAEQGGVQ